MVRLVLLQLTSLHCLCSAVALPLVHIMAALASTKTNNKAVAYILASKQFHQDTSAHVRDDGGNISTSCCVLEHGRRMGHAVKATTRSMTRCCKLRKPCLKKPLCCTVRVFICGAYGKTDV